MADQHAGFERKALESLHYRVRRLLSLLDMVKAGERVTPTLITNQIDLVFRAGLKLFGKGLMRKLVEGLMADARLQEGLCPACDRSNALKPGQGICDECDQEGRRAEAEIEFDEIDPEDLGRH